MHDRGKSLPQRRSVRALVCIRNISIPQSFRLSSIASANYELFATFVHHLAFVLISLRTRCVGSTPSSYFSAVGPTLMCSTTSTYIHSWRLRLSPMFSAKYELFAPFCNVDPLCSSLYELFCAKTPGVGGGYKNAAVIRCARKDENII